MADHKSMLRGVRFYVSVACAMAVMIAVTFPRGGSSFKYLYQTGRPWAYDDLLAPIDFPILKSESERLLEMERKSSAMIPFYQYDQTVWPQAYDALKAVLEESEPDVELLEELVTALKYVYDAGITNDSFDSDVIMICRGKHASDCPAASVFSIRSAERYIVGDIESSGLMSQDGRRFMSELKLDGFLSENLVYDSEKTEEIHRQAFEDISPTKGMFYAGGLIVSKGEIVTPEIAQILDSYRNEVTMTDGGGGPVTGLVAGRVLVSLIILAAMMAAIHFSDHRHVFKWRDLYYVLTLLILLLALTAAASKISDKAIYLVPYPVFALFLMSFYRPYQTFPIYMMMLLPILLLIQDGVGLYFINLMAGVTTILVFRRHDKGWQQFVNAFYIFITLTASFISFTLMWNGSLSYDMVAPIWLMFLSSLLVVFLYPMVYLFEKIFSLVSRRRLIELGDMNNPLLREMSAKAPGSFQHSLQVANLAGEAAHELDVNEALVRAGALYHDIGKMKNPLCFVENQPAGMNYHAGLPLRESVEQIIRHVDDGVELARKKKLPEEVVDFIRTHHARSLVRYFYASYVKSGGDPQNKAPFTYHGMLPQTEEQVIVMMADSIEAASRTLGDYSESSIRKLVEDMITARLQEGQLVEADMPLRDLTCLKEIFVRKISQIYHDRITYPKL